MHPAKQGSLYYRGHNQHKVRSPEKREFTGIPRLFSVQITSMIEMPIKNKTAQLLRCAVFKNKSLKN
jgi:hypothetical protein